jgi:hypothetical protein
MVACSEDENLYPAGSKVVSETVVWPGASSVLSTLDTFRPVFSSKLAKMPNSLKEMIYPVSYSHSYYPCFFYVGYLGLDRFSWASWSTPCYLLERNDARVPRQLVPSGCPPVQIPEIRRKPRRRAASLLAPCFSSIRCVQRS